MITQDRMEFPMPTKARSLVAWPISSDCSVQEPFINLESIHS